MAHQKTNRNNQTHTKNRHSDVMEAKGGWKAPAVLSWGFLRLIQIQTGRSHEYIF